MKKLVLLAVLLATATLLFATGVPTGEEGVTTIRWAYWGGETRVQISQEAIDIFEQQYPNIRVNPEPSGGAGDHFVRVDTQLAGGGGPDIIQMGGNIPDYVGRGVLLPLEVYGGTILDVDAIDDSAIQSGTINGHLYGVSTGVTMPALVYNKDLIERSGAPLPDPSMTYAEFEDYLEVLKDHLPSGVYPMMDIGALASNSTPFGYWCRYNGTPLYDAASGTTDVTAAGATAYLQQFAQWRAAGLIPPADVAAGFAESNADTSALVAGRVAIGFIWTNMLAGYQSTMTDEIDLMEFPGAAATDALWQAPSQFYTVNIYSEHQREAVQFINFLVNSPDAAAVLGNDRGASASATARTATLPNASDAKVLEYLAVAGPHTSAETDHVPNDTEFNSTLYLIYQQVAFGQITAAEGGQQIYDLINRMIEK